MFRVTSRIDANTAMWVEFGGLRNPLSFAPTNIFTVESSDDSGALISKGTIDFVQMTKMIEFTEMTVVPLKKVNGAETTYTISFKTTLPVENGDRFHLQLPTTGEVAGPKEPTCKAIKCLG